MTAEMGDGVGGIMLIVVARYVVAEGYESAVARLLRTNAEASRAEPGCLEFSVYQQIDDRRAFLLYERYTSEDAFQAHRRTPHFHHIIEQQVVPLLNERAWTRVKELPENPDNPFAGDAS
jgi:quinol monooxygenase YgiN